MNLCSLVRTPPPHVDDAWYGSRAWAFIHTGWPFGPLDAGVLDRFEGYWSYLPWLGSFFQSLPLRILGLSFFSVRLSSLIFGLLLLVTLYAIGAALEGPRAGLLTVLLVSLSRPFLYSSHLGRPDIMVAAFGYGAVALYLTDRATGWSLKSVLCGLAIGLSFDLHPNDSLIYGPALFGLYLFDYRWSLLRAQRFWGFVAGALAGLAFCFLMHVVRYPRTYLAMTGLIAGASRLPPILELSPSVWCKSFLDAAALLNHFGGIRWLGTGLIIIFLAHKPSAGIRKALVLALGLTLLLAALFRHKHSYHAILLSPAMDLLLAIGLTRLGRALAEACSPRRRPAMLTFMLPLALLSTLLIVEGAFTLVLLRQDPMAEYTPTLERIRQTVPPGHSIMGPQTFWFALPGETYLSWENLVYYQRYAPGSTLTDALWALRPDYFIIDNVMATFAIADDKSKLTSYGQVLHLPKAELEGFLARQAQQVDTIHTQTFGAIHIYRIHWDRESG